MGQSVDAGLFGRRQRFLQAFRKRFFLRFHMTLIMIAVLFSGVLASKILWAVGVTSMAARYPMAVVCSYGVFFALVSIWLWYIHSAQDGDQAASVDAVDAVTQMARGGVELNRGLSTGDDHVSDMAASVSNQVSRGGGGSSSGGGSSLSLGDGDGEGGLIILVVLAIVLIIVFCSGVYVIWEAPNILAEAAFQAILATSLQRRARQVDQPGWTGSVLQATWWPFAIVLVATSVFGWVASHYCPGATRLPEVLNVCLPGLSR